MAKRDPLGVWLYGLRVAELTSQKPGEVICRYTKEALDAWPGNTPLLSCSLPLTTQRQQAGVFFSGVLPEGKHRQALASEARLPTYDTFGLLARFGKDIAGAAIVAFEDPGERPGAVIPYTKSTLEDDVAMLPEHPLGIHDDSELSLAGLQDKLLLVDLGECAWGRPTHGRASTHILKVEDRRFSGMAQAEAACLLLSRHLNLTTVDATVDVIANMQCLIVSRFDRSFEADGTVNRIHQEDACQALARDPDAERGRGKYESAGGPSLREVAGLLDRFAGEPESELAQLIRMVTFTVLIGNADAHGKNVALIHPTPGSIKLAPLYDMVPTFLWPALRTTGAMAINNKWHLDQITRDDVVTEAGAWPLDPVRAKQQVISTAEEVLGAVGTIDMSEQFEVRLRARTESFLRT